MKTKAAVTPEKGADFEIREIELKEPNNNEVLVEIVASSICHTDVSGKETGTPPTPSVLGHEGAGIIRKIGSSVKEFKVGDHVVLSYAHCGKCEQCLSGHPASCEQMIELNFGGRTIDGTKRHFDKNQEYSLFFGQSSFATYSVVNEQNAVKVPKDIDLENLGALSCSIQTGAGTVLNSFNSEFGSSIVIFGMGGVGLGAVMAAKLAGYKEIIGIDIQTSRLEVAENLGATKVINSKNSEDLVDNIRSITEKGPEYIIDTTGVSSLIEDGIKALKTRGTIAVVGANFDFNVQQHLMEEDKSIVGLSQGDSIPKLFIPQLIDYYKKGLFPFDELITKYRFEDINNAFEDLKIGEVIKPVLVMG